VRRGVGQAHALVLRGDIAEVGAELRELRGRRELAVEESAAAALGLDDATDDQLAVTRHTGRFELRGDARARLDLEERGDLGLTSTATDDLRTGAAAEHERQGVDDHRLARAGLTGQHVEARPELEDLMLDEDDVVDRQREQHASAEYSSQSSRSSLLRRKHPRCGSRARASRPDTSRRPMATRWAYPPATTHT